MRMKKKSDSHELTAEATSTASNSEQLEDVRMITALEMSEILGCSVSSVYAWSDRNSKNYIEEFPVPVQLGPKRTRFRYSDVLRFVNSLKPIAERKHHFRSGARAA